MLFQCLKVTGYNEELSASTALHEAVLTDNTEIVCYLLSMLCLDVNATNSLEERPIHMATSINSVKMLEVLFEKGCDVNAKDDIGYTALHDAAERGNLNAVKRLLKHPEVDSSAINNGGKTPCQVACRWKNGSLRKQIQALITEHQNTHLHARMWVL